MHFAMVRKADGMVMSTMDINDIETLALNIPEDCDAHACDDLTVEPGKAQWANNNFVKIASPVATLAQVKAGLVADTKSLSENLKMGSISPGGAKKVVYNAQLAEIEAYRGLLTTLGGVVSGVVTALTGMAKVERERKFRYALMSAAKRGEGLNIAPAIARFEAGEAKANNELARIESIEQDAVEKINKATTIPAAKAIAAGINWDWKPA